MEKIKQVQEMFWLLFQKLMQKGLGHYYWNHKKLQ